VIAAQARADKIARLELCREYFTNPDFRKALENACVGSQPLKRRGFGYASQWLWGASLR